jgi:hypothetical protein
MVNLGSRAFYRHDGRSPLPTKCRKTPLIKALIGKASGLDLQPNLDIEINPT